MKITAKIHAAFSPPDVRLEDKMTTNGISQIMAPTKKRKIPAIASIMLLLDFQLMHSLALSLFTKTVSKASAKF
jgi:hypothetical protein